MPFGLTMGTERANALQQSIQDELTKRGYSQDADPVMAEYITIMVINNKTAGQITTELEDLIGSEYDPTFTDWLFVEAAKGNSAPEIPQQAQPLPPPSPPNEQPTREPPSHPPRDSSTRTSHPPRSGIYQQALSQATSSNSSQKRSASARSPSPGLPNKSRKTDLPTGPRAMQREVGPTNSRSLLDRMGGHAASNRHQRDEIQARIDNITNSSSEANMMMGGGGFPNMPMAGMDMNAMAMANPLMLQEMFMNNMALMQHLSSQIGMMQGFANAPPGFNLPGNGVANEAGMFHGGSNNFGQANRGRGSGRGRGTGRGRGGSHVGASSSPKVIETTMPSEAPATPSNIPPQSSANTPATPTVVSPIRAPAPIAPVATPAQTSSVPQVPYAVPERPQSPTLCKFGLKCTNAHCRWSHPSPVATPESGVVLSNEACENGKNCKDKDCIKAHVSPAALHPPTQPPVPAPSVVPHTPPNPTPCRFGLACTRPNCMFSHPSRPTSNSQHATPCRFGTGCTRAACPYQHPEGRVLPTTFHRGLAPGGPMVHIQNPETGSMGPSPHRSVTFNNPKSKLDKQVKDLEERKNDAEKAIKEAQVAAAANGKEELKPVATAA